VIQVITRAIGTAYKSFRKSERQTRKARNQGTTENSRIGHCTHNAESAVLMYQHRTFNTGNNITGTVNCNYRIAATVYTPGTLFLLGNIMVNIMVNIMANTPHISDNNSNSNNNNNNNKRNYTFTQYESTHSESTQNSLYQLGSSF